jgi:tumor protein p53-inducible protein 3
VMLKIEATAVNRADILQRCGKYPPPEGASNIIGLEAVGKIVDSKTL